MTFRPMQQFQEVVRAGRVRKTNHVVDVLVVNNTKYVVVFFVFTRILFIFLVIKLQDRAMLEMRRSFHPRSPSFRSVVFGSRWREKNRFP
jgi:hypothetical protein